MKDRLSEGVDATTVTMRLALGRYASGKNVAPGAGVDWAFEPSISATPIRPLLSCGLCRPVQPASRRAGVALSAD
ncbi:MAG: hypothetical protein ACTS5I_01895, partial [Rhodanobacter sp.]